MRRLVVLFLLLSMILVSCSSSAPQSTSVVITQIVVVTATELPTPIPSNVPTQTSSPTDTAAPLPISTLTATITPTISSNVELFRIKSVDVMKWSQDVLRNQPDDQFMAKMVELIRQLGATHVAISVPYDSPSNMPSNTSVQFTRRWVSAIRAGGLNVWFRQSPLSFKGFYDTPINSNLQDHIHLIADYIRTNPDLFAAGDIFTPIPEPQVERTYGINCFTDSCLFKDVNQLALFMETAKTESEAAFDAIGLTGQVEVGHWGLDGFILWGDRNPDWEGKPQTATNGSSLAAADNHSICIDHYFPPDADPQAEFLKIRNAFPDSQLWICEWGPIAGQSPAYVEQVLQAALDNGVIAFNWWQSGPGGAEALFEYDLNNNPHPTQYYEVLRKFYTSGN